MAFLKDPEGAPLWEEDPEAKDVVHIDSEKVRELRRCSLFYKCMRWRDCVRLC